MSLNLNFDFLTCQTMNEWSNQRNNVAPSVEDFQTQNVTFDLLEFCDQTELWLGSQRS